MTNPDLVPAGGGLVENSQPAHRGQQPYHGRLVHRRRLIYSLYVHIPFCRRRCSYCDFNTYAGLEGMIPAYVAALSAEIRLAGQAFRVEAPAAHPPAAGAGDDERLPVHTVFVGGGTPSLLPLVELERIFGAVGEAFHLLPGAEISLEANPGTLDTTALGGLRALGVNRLSLGLQSAHADELALLGRIHTFAQAEQAVAWARKAGFDNINLDAIFGLPGQTLARWEATLHQALGLGVEHLSLYALTLEAGTPLLARVAAGELPQPDPDLAADMYDLATGLLAGAGYQQYEISNWARPAGAGQDGPDDPACVRNPAYACRHNLQYWRNQPYIGVGAGAHAYVSFAASGNSGAVSGEDAFHTQTSANSHPRGVRIANVLAPAEYIRRMAISPSPRCVRSGLCWHLLGESRGEVFPAADQVTPLSLLDEIGETMMMGLRLTREGVSRSGFHARFGRRLEDEFGAQIDRLVRLGLLEWAGTDQDVLRLTQRGRFVGNQVFVEFI